MSKQFIHNPDHYLWHVRITNDEDSFTCNFDVLPAGARFIDAGSPEFCEQLVAALDVRTDRIVDWSLTRICSSYYADRPTDEDWRKRFRLAWHMAVLGDGQPSRTGYLGIGPFPALGQDPTWRRKSTDWNLITEDCEVIADKVLAANSPNKAWSADEIARRLPSYDVTFEDFPVPGGTLLHYRIAMGSLELENEHERIDDVLADCENEGLLTYCRRTLLRVADLTDEAGVTK
jgi:hypothetical protein